MKNNRSFLLEPDGVHTPSCEEGHQNSFLACTSALVLHDQPRSPAGWPVIMRPLIYLHVRVGKAAGRQVVGVHSNRLLFGSHVFIFVKRQWIHRTLIIQTTSMERQKCQMLI